MRKTVNPLDLGVNGEQLVIKFRTTLGDDGKFTGKYETLATAGRIIGKNGKPYIVGTVGEGEGAKKLIVAGANTLKSDKHPVAYLKELPTEEGADSVILCGLYVRKYDDGSFALTGKPLQAEEPIQYYIAIDKNQPAKAANS